MQGWDFLTEKEQRQSSPAQNQGTINIKENRTIFEAAKAMVDAERVVPATDKSKNDKVKSDVHVGP